MTKLQQKTIELADDKIRKTRNDIFGIEHRIRKLKEKIRDIRSSDETNRSDDPALLELHKMIDDLMGDLSPNNLQEASDWLGCLED